MSRALEAVVPGALRELLESDDLAAAEGFTMLLVTTTEDGWPHMAMVSVGEVVPVDEPQSLRLALWPGSTATRNVTPSGRAMLAAVVGGTLLAQARARAHGRGGDAARRHARALRGAGGRRERREAPYAVLESGVRFRLKDPADTRARWAELRAALRQG